ncbi:MAG: restriction endonuclease subunit S [Krumholzibacteria bacterium]|nr:restriction endonuclease subunit S [Candidatus Krumholzibacteria bacterium]
MKTGWQNKRLDEVCHFTNGLWKGKKPPFLTVGVIRNTNFTKNGTLNDSDIAYIEVEAKKFEKRRLQFGDIILEKSGGGPKQPVGRVVLFDKEDGDFSFSNFTAALRVKDADELDFRYLHKCLFWIYQSGVTEGMQSHSTGIRNLDGDAYKAIEVRFPPLPEQRRIVGILDEAFAGLATAQANAEKNLQNARALFESHLRSVFSQRGPGRVEAEKGKPILEERQRPADNAQMARLHAGFVTRTGGRVATTRHIPGPLSLSVGMPNVPPKKGWRWSALSDLARLESGHTPSRRHPEYWGGPIPWIGIQDARCHHGREIENTAQTINELGTANSSARVLPAHTVCLSRTASVGYVVVMGCPMATSQDFVNWVCSDNLIPNFLKYVFLAEGRDGLLRYASGSVHQTIYYPEAKAFHICHPTPDQQRKIVEQCDVLATETQRLARLYDHKQTALAALKSSLLHQAFTGAL